LLKVRSLKASHRFEEDRELRLALIQFLKDGLSMDFHLGLRQPRLKCLAKIVPEPEKPSVQHLGQTANVRWTLLVQERVGFGGISVKTLGSVANSVEKPQCDERIEKVEPATRMDIQLLT
jgi:hypothetical protein